MRARLRQGYGGQARMTRDARAALRQAGFSRRSFLKGSGALIVTFSVGSLADTLGTVAAQGINGAPAKTLDAWIAIGTDGIVTAYTGKCEFGQGLYTAQMQLIAEEVGVPLNRVRLIQCDTSMTPDQGTTSGAQSHPANFNRANLALAGATAREALVRLASQQLGVGADQLVAADGAVAVRGDASRRVTYATLVGGRKFDLPLSGTAKRKHPREWTVLGTAVPRVDLPALVTGEFEFVHNVRVPGMLHGQVVRPPTVGARVVSVNEASVRNMPGVVKVVVKNDFVGVVAQKPWQALQAASALNVTWSNGSGLPDQQTLSDFLRAQPPRDTMLVDSQDVDATLKSAATLVSATYRFPYHMHGSVGSSCAVADVQADRATLWSATQAVWPMRNTAATVLGLKPESVRVVYTRGSGCYGINGADTVTYDAALLSQAVGKPVRVQLTRKDEMAWENYGLPFVIAQRAGVDASGTIVAWDYEGWTAGRGGRPGYQNPGNVVTGFLAGFKPAAFTPRAPAPAPTNPLDNGENTAPSYVAGRVGTEARGAGVVKSERILMHRIESPFFTGPLRSPERLQNTFAHECFMDEVAARAKADPIAFRLKHLSEERIATALREVAKAAKWETRPSPRTSRPANGVASGRGVACVAYEGDNSYLAMVAEVDVVLATGEVRVKRIVTAQDSGPVSNPDGIRNQIEGGALHGMSRALMEEVTWDAQKVTSIDWRTYRTLPVGSPMPVLETVVINNVEEDACGAGEASITVVTAAIGNAIFDATGARVRQVPFTPARVKAALAERT
jgi:CO/xanthine dehydrogenase Mo-binding subunit